MNEKKNKGFSLIELCVAIGILGVMITISTPKIRDYMMIAENAKAVATLHTLRTASEIYYSETGKPAFAGKDYTKNGTTEALSKLKRFLDEKTYNAVKDGSIPIGGAKETASDDAEINYGGTIPVSFFLPVNELDNPPKKNGALEDGIQIWFRPENAQKYNHNNVEWTSF